MHPSVVRQPEPASRRLVLFVSFLFAALFIAPPLANAATVQPAELRFDSRLDDTPLLRIEVDLEGIAPTNFTADLNGFSGDRRVTAHGEGKFTVEIAPDTIEIGSVQGSVILKNDGKP